MLSHADALDVLAHGTLIFEGSTADIPDTDHHHRFYASVGTTTGSTEAMATRSRFQNTAIGNMSLSLVGNLEGLHPEGSLEYPNMLYAFGASPGTTTLTWFVGQRGDIRTPTAYGSRARPRKMKLIAILERLEELKTYFVDEVCLLPRERLFQPQC
jgi:hypothetical protein